MISEIVGLKSAFYDWNVKPYMIITYIRVSINRVRSPILLVVSWTGKHNIFLSPFAPEEWVSQDGFGRPVPCQFAHFPHSGWLTGFLPISAAASIYLYRHTPSSQSRVYWVTLLCTDGVHCRESAGTGPVVLKVVPVSGAAFLCSYRHGPINVRLYFTTPTIGMK